jgi:predicted nucleic acid-binding protein
VARRKRSRSGARASPAARARASAAAEGFHYVETSALLAALLERDIPARDALRAPGRRITSALTFAEACRALVRARTAARLSAADERAALRWLRTFRRRCDVVSVTESVLARAGRPFPVEPIRTLDAVHLATAEALGEPPQLVTILTRDVRVGDNARALGYAVE